MITKNDRGIDVSYWQGNIDFNKVKAAGYTFVIPRCSVADVDTGNQFVDKNFHANVKNALKAGLVIPGVYLFSGAENEKRAAEEADFAVALCKEVGLPSSTIIFFDFEYESDDCVSRRLGRTLSKTARTKIANKFCDRVLSLGFKTGIYANNDYFDNKFAMSLFTKSYILWCAAWDGIKPSISNAAFHQYTSSDSVPGISGRVDANRYLLSDSIGEEIPANEPKKSVDELAKEVIEGKWGNGEDRKKRLTDSGYDYDVVQALVNKLVAPKPTKSVDELAKEVIEGKWGNGEERKSKLTSAGYNYQAVQNKVNEMLSSKPTKAVAPAMSFDTNLSGTYTVTANSLNLRYEPNVIETSNVIKVLPRGTKVKNYGYYTQFKNSKWLLVKVGDITGFVDSSYVRR